MLSAMTYARWIVALLLCLPLLAGSIDGKWSGPMEGADRDVVFQLKTEGAKVTGTMSGAGGESHPITEGALTGDDISLTVASEWQGSPVKLLVKGKVSGNEMRLTISSEGGEWSTDVVVKKAAE